MSPDQKRTSKLSNPLHQKGESSAQDFLERHAQQIKNLLEIDSPISFDQTIGLLEEALGQIKGCEKNRLVEGAGPGPEENRYNREFLFKTFHEMRNPLHAIMGYASLVLRKTRDQIPLKHQENLEKVIQSADRLKELVDRMVAFYRGEMNE
jgi:signal transduction histidine kinase